MYGGTYGKQDYERDAERRKLDGNTVWRETFDHFVDANKTIPMAPVNPAEAPGISQPIRMLAEQLVASLTTKGHRNTFAENVPWTAAMIDSAFGIPTTETNEVPHG